MHLSEDVEEQLIDYKTTFERTIDPVKYGPKTFS